MVSLPTHCLHTVSRAGDILLLFILLPTAAIMALTEPVCTPRSPLHISNTRLQQARFRGAQRSGSGCENKAIIMQQCHTQVSKFVPHILLPFLSSQGHVKLHFGTDRDKKFTGLQLFLQRAIKPILNFLVDRKTRARTAHQQF